MRKERTLGQTAYGEQSFNHKTLDTKQPEVNYDEMRKEVLKLHEKGGAIDSVVCNLRTKIVKNIIYHKNELLEAFKLYTYIVPNANETSWNIFLGVEDRDGNPWNCDLHISRTKDRIGSLYFYQKYTDGQHRTEEFSYSDAEYHFGKIKDMVLSYVALNPEEAPRIVENWREKIQNWYEATQEHLNAENEKNSKTKEKLEQILEKLPKAEE